MQGDRDTEINDRALSHLTFMQIYTHMYIPIHSLMVKKNVVAVKVKFLEGIINDK